MAKNLFDDGILYDADDFAVYTSQYMTNGVIGSNPSVSTTANTITISAFQCLLSGRCADLDQKTLSLSSTRKSGLYTGCLVYMIEEDETPTIKIYESPVYKTSAEEAKKQAQNTTPNEDGEILPIAVIALGYDSTDDIVDVVCQKAGRRYTYETEIADIPTKLDGICQSMYEKARTKIESVKAVYFPSAELVSVSATPTSTDGSTWNAIIYYPEGYDLITNKVLFFINDRLAFVSTPTSVANAKHFHDCQLSLTAPKTLPVNEDYTVRMYCTKTKTQTKTGNACLFSIHYSFVSNKL